MSRKIDDKELLRLADGGTPQKEIARIMGVSGPAISKRLRKLRAVAARPEVLDALTPQQERYVMEVVSGKNQTQAALAAYECGSLDSAKTLGSRLAKNEVIQEAITAVMEAEGLTRGVLVKRLKDHVEGKDASVSLKAVKTGLELHDCFPAAKSLRMNVNIEVSPVDLSKYRNR
jgi:DNA-binding CsgD family transcriptional regulator